MKNFFRDLVEQLRDEDTSIVDDGSGSAEYTGCIDTGSYIVNAVLSGSIYGGVPNNKITAFAGESATGKTFFVLGIGIVTGKQIGRASCRERVYVLV